MIRRHRLLACLGLLALGLAIGGPLLSQSQRLLEAEHAAHGAPRHDEQPTSHHEAYSSGEPSKHHATLEACDYCTLFLHMPGMLLGKTVAPDLRHASPSPPVVPKWRLGPGERYPRYRGRAPPPRSV
ncbi:DUF2946 family protein [Billgrantia saliphila]|uniref:DUF2946 family protein n=1 Tax=Billgrantia saliphila TaxID=1848458 RepID=UPI003BEEB9A8